MEQKQCSEELNGARSMTHQEFYQFEEIMDTAVDSLTRVYDPRTNSYVHTDNPILILADQIKHYYVEKRVELQHIDPSKEAFWADIAALATEAENESYK